MTGIAKKKTYDNEITAELELDSAVLYGGQKYVIEITAPEVTDENSVCIKRLSLCRTINNYFGAVACLILFISANLWWFNADKSVEKWAPGVLIGAGLIMLIIMSPSSQPNENNHYNATLKLSNLLLGRQILNETEGEYECRPGQHYNYNSTFVEMIKHFWDSGEIDREEVFIHRYSFDIEQPISYLAPAIGMTVGRLLGCNYFQTYTLARLFHFIAFVIMICFAIRLMPFNKELILLIALMPMSMQQATSLSYDAVVNGMAIIYFAYLLRIIHEGKDFSVKNVLICTLLPGTFGPVKIVYCILALLVFMIPAKQFRVFRDRMLKCFSVLFITAFILMLTRYTDIASRVDGSIFGEVNPYYDMAFILKHPLMFSGIIARTLRNSVWTYLEEAVGSRLANYSIIIPLWWIRIYLLVLLIHAVFRDEKVLPDIKQRAIMLGTSALLFLSIMVTMALTYTPSDVGSIIGVQGRYFIPFFAPVLYCMSANKIPLKINRKYFTALIWFVYLGVIFEVMSQIVY